MSLKDSELVHRIKNKDKEAFVVLFDKYKGRIVRFLYGFFGDYGKAEDATIETFLKVYKNIHNYEERGSFQSWLFTIAANQGRLEIKRTKRRKEISLDMPIENDDAARLVDLIEDEKLRPDTDIVVDDLKDFIYRILSEMKEKYADIIRLCDIEKLSYEEASQVLNCSPFTVRTRLRRARVKLYKLAKKYKDAL